MASNIIGDAKYQELKMSFAFQELQDKLIIDVVADHTSYQLELHANPDLDFEELKHAFINKNFKLVQRTSELLKLKIAVISFEFKNVQKITLSELKTKMQDLTHQLHEQSRKNFILEDSINKFRAQFERTTTKIAENNRANDLKNQRILQELAQLKQNYKETKDQLMQIKEKKLQQVIKTGNPDAKIEQHSQRIYELRQELNIQKFQTKNQANKLRENEQLMSEMSDKIVFLLKKVSEMNQGEKIKHVQVKQIQKVKFCQQNTSNFIILSNNNSTATKKQKQGYNELALVDGAVLKKGSSIRFLIQYVGEFVRVGLCIRNLVASRSFQLQNYKQIGHGCFFLGHNFISFSHSNKEYNYVKTNLKYGKGDVIRVETKVDELLFFNETKNEQFVMKIKLTENEWQQACFCVLLCDKGDSVSIL